MQRKPAPIFTQSLILVIALLGASCWGQKITSLERYRAQDMLSQVSNDVKHNYYDPKFHGVDWNAAVETAKKKIDAAGTSSLAYAEVAAALDSLNDSHTFLLPPAFANRHDYGWQGEVIGDRCFIVRVRPGSDAEKKGVKAGDELVALNGYTPNRRNFQKMQYVFNTLRPQRALRLDLAGPADGRRVVDVATTFVPGRRVMDLTADGSQDIWQVIRQQESDADAGKPRFAEVGDVGILKLPNFMVNPSEIDYMMGKARKHPALVVDLRGDPGGSTETLKELVGNCFDKDVKIGNRVGRSRHEPMMAKRHGHPFTGKLVVLVDSKSASAAELFARVVQIEKRGTIIGDRSSGSVMEARHYSHRLGMDTVVFYGVSITDADIVMTDGKSLEHNGVVPDEVALPTGADLASGSDPVLARAVEFAGGTLSPEAAGKLFPYTWPPL